MAEQSEQDNLDIWVRSVGTTRFWVVTSVKLSVDPSPPAVQLSPAIVPDSNEFMVAAKTPGCAKRRNKKLKPKALMNIRDMKSPSILLVTTFVEEVGGIRHFGSEPVGNDDIITIKLISRNRFDDPNSRKISVWDQTSEDFETVGKHLLLNATIRSTTSGIGS
jgi:hypothetical protein